MNVLFSTLAWRQYLQWQTQNPKITKKINQLISSTRRTPFKGLGKLELLKQNLKGCWSRRINKEHRLVYRIVKSNAGIKRIEVVSCQFHY